MAKYEQKTIERFFQDFQVADAETKAGLLPLLTDVIYDYNLHTIEYEKEKDDYRKEQIAVEIKEIEDKIKDIVEHEKNK